MLGVGFLMIFIIGRTRLGNLCVCNPYEVLTVQPYMSEGSLAKRIASVYFWALSLRGYINEIEWFITVTTIFSEGIFFSICFICWGRDLLTRFIQFAGVSEVCYCVGHSKGLGEDVDWFFFFCTFDLLRMIDFGGKILIYIYFSLFQVSHILWVKNWIWL